MIALIKFEYRERDQIKEYPLEKQKEFCDYIGEPYNDSDIKREENEEGVVVKEYLDVSLYNNYLVDLREFAEKYSMPFAVVQLKNTPERALIESVQELNRKIDKTQFHVNQRCNVHVSNLGLLKIKKVIVEEDLCTHRLQDLLDEGWKILAICIQPDQRRPDYVLGRAKEQ